MIRLSIKEKIAFGIVFNEKREYQYWYTRFLICGVDLERIRRVVARIKNWYGWCSEWSKEGQFLENMAKDALSKGNTYGARWLFHEAAGCFYIGQHFFYIDADQKNKALKRVWENYQRAIDLYDENQRPIRIEVPFRETVIPGYLRITEQLGKPLVIRSTEWTT